MTQTISIITSIFLIIFYFFFKFAIHYENKEFNKDKIIINNYTLVLHQLNINSKDYFQEINDLIKHLNKIISDEMKKNDILLSEDYDKENNFKDLYIFDIIISNVNEKKIELIDKIKSIQNVIIDIKEDNDSIKKKIKNKINDTYKSVHSLYRKMTIKKEDKLINEKLLDDSESPSLFEKEEENPLEKEEKIINQKTNLKEQLIDIKGGIIKLHNESNQKKYVDIYIIFKSPSISNLIYKIYKKNIIRRCIFKALCCCNKYKKYYFKKQWLNFRLANNAPSNIIWENCYISTISKKKQRCISLLISFFLILFSSLLIIFLMEIAKDSGTIPNLIIVIVCQGINLFSCILFEKLTNYEKYSSMTKKLSSNIIKIFCLNFLIQGIFISLVTGFTYIDVQKDYEIIKTILMNMLFSIFTSQASPICKYLWNLFKRYLDSKFTNGKITKLNNRKQYEKLYTGEEFPISQRYSIIYVNLFICCLYGTICPLIYLFFSFFLIATFIVDKYLIINYYKKPPYYDNYLSKKTSKFLLVGIIIYFYGTIHHLSNPYLFNYYQNDNYNIFYEEYFFLFNPLAFIYSLFSDLYEIPCLIYNYINLSFPYYILLIYIFLFPILILKIIKLFSLFKKNITNSLKNSPNIDIGLSYSLDELNKYYEIKKLELFKLAICEDNGKLKENYANLFNNYKLVIDYLKQNINTKHTKETRLEENEKENLNVKENNKQFDDNTLLGDTSYNLAFIPDYQIYDYFDLLY